MIKGDGREPIDRGRPGAVTSCPAVRVPFVGHAVARRRSDNRYGLVAVARVPIRPAISTATALVKVTKFGMPSYEGPKISQKERMALLAVSY